MYRKCHLMIMMFAIMSSVSIEVFKFFEKGMKTGESVKEWPYWRKGRQNGYRYG